MKYLKKFEDINRLPKEYDWVITEPNIYCENEMLGQIIFEYPNKRYIIFFETTKEEKTLGVDQLKYWSNNKDEIETFLYAKKYNI